MIRRLTTLTCALLPICLGAEDWSQWRGPNRNGHISEQPWPESLSESNLQRSWSVPLGPGYSGPIISGNRVFVTETRDRSHEVVRALDRLTGEELWRVEWPGALEVPFFARANGSWIRSTPACDGEYLYVLGIRDHLVCLDVQTGSQVWHVDLVERLGSALPSFGAVCSPLLDGDFVYLQAGASAVKLSKQTGEVVWRSEAESGGLFGEAMGASPFSSPVIDVLADHRQLIIQTRQSLAGYDLESGSELWSVDIPAFRGMNILTPLVRGDTVLTSSYGGGTFLFDIEQKDGKFIVNERWKNKKQGYMSSPIEIDGHVYLHLRNQRLTCLHRETGETRWTSTPFGKYWSMVVNGNKILALDERGDLKLIDATSEAYVERSSREVSESTSWAHLAFTEGQIFIRALDGITAWQWSDGDALRTP